MVLPERKRIKCIPCGDESPHGTDRIRLNPVGKGSQSLLAAAFNGIYLANACNNITLEEYNKLVKPSLDARASIAQLESQLEAQIKLRDQADRVSHTEVLRLARSIHDHKQFGPNSGLYKELGYVTDDERKSGLHRAGVAAAAAKPGAN